jgi:hypothetical protein
MPDFPKIFLLFQFVQYSVAALRCCVAALLRCCAFPTCWVMIKAPVLAVPGSWLAQRTYKLGENWGLFHQLLAAVTALAALAALAASWVALEGPMAAKSRESG